MISPPCLHQAERGQKCRGGGARQFLNSEPDKGLRAHEARVNGVILFMDGGGGLLKGSENERRCEPKPFVRIGVRDKRI